MLTKYINHIDRRIRLLISVLIGIGLAWWCKHYNHSHAVAYMIGWIGFSGSMLLFAWFTILQKNPQRVAVVATEQDNSRVVVFLFAVTAAMVSLGAIVILLQNLPSYSKQGLSLHILLSVISVTCSWLLIHTLFTLRYAHLYYHYETSQHQEDGQHRGGLSFPEEPEPDLLDFAYFSFVLGMTFQVSDVSISSQRIRRVVLLHSLLSFIYNTAIVAFSINILSGIIGK